MFLIEKLFDRVKFVDLIVISSYSTRDSDRDLGTHSPSGTLGNFPSRR